MRTAGFVLAGGRSSRMGRDKALLPTPSGPLLCKIAQTVQSAAGTVALIGDPARYGHLGYDCLPDLRSGLGPLAGIETALASGRGEWNVIVACDMPSLDPAWLHLLLHKAAGSPALCTALRDASQTVQPLCAVYRTASLRLIQNALDHRRLKLLDVVNQLGVQAVDISRPLTNLNTPEDWIAWQTMEGSSLSTHGR